MRGDFESGEDVAAVRRFTGLSQETLALVLGISVRTLRNWERGRGMPVGPAPTLLRVGARHPKMLRGNPVDRGGLTPR